MSKQSLKRGGCESASVAYFADGKLESEAHLLGIFAFRCLSSSRSSDEDG